jgi:putative cell wall-binding protein
MPIVKRIGHCAVVAALTAVVIALSTAVLGEPGIAGATSTPTGSISATGSPPVASTGTALPAGSLKITLSASGLLPAGATLALQVEPSISGHVTWDTYDISAHTISVQQFGAATTILDIELGAKDTNTLAVLDVTQIKYATKNAVGELVVSARMSNGVTFSPSTATDGVLVQTPPKPPTIKLSALSQPTVKIGTSGAAAGDWTVTMTGDRATGNGWTAGTALTVTVAPPKGTNCATGTYLYFVGTPTAKVSSAIGTTTVPTVSPALASVGGCAITEPNELVLTLVNADYFDTSSMGTVTIDVTGIHYAVGTTASAMGTGSVVVDASFSATPSSVTVAGASNASVEAVSSGTTTPPAGSGTASSQPASPLSVRADTPPVTMLEGAFDAAISPVTVTGSAGAHVPAGYVCLSLSSGSFSTTAAASVAVSAGNGTAGSTVTYQDQGDTGAVVAEFQVSKSSTTQDAYTVSGLAVDAPTATGPVSIKVTDGASSSCAQDSSLVGVAIGFSVARTPVTRVFGATPDATAAAELEYQFDAQGTDCPGRPGARPVVLATDANFPDALASAYLASSLGTGELLTPTAGLSAATENAIRLEGITQVYIVGGPLAVSTAVSQQLESTLAYDCGGSAPLTAAGPVHLEVIRIAGATEYDTAQWIAEYPPAGTVGSLDVSSAYVGSDRTGGSGRFNDTSGNASSPPATSSTLPTAIVADGHEFQDAEAASALSYANRLPILLTTPGTISPQVPSAIGDLGIKQVIVMGGPLAVSDGVVSSLESLGVSVLRIAGQDAADTAVQLADFEMGPKTGHVGVGWNGSGGVTVARGDFFTDGLAGAIVAAGGGRTHTHAPQPLLLCTNTSTVGHYLSAFLATAGRTGIDGNGADRIAALTILGGPEAVSPSTAATMIGDL